MTPAIVAALYAASVSMVVPALPSFSHGELGLSWGVTPAYFLVASTVGIPTLLLLGRRSDKVGARRRIIVVALTWGGTGQLLLAFCTQAWQILVLAALFGSTFGFVTSQIYASISEQASITEADRQKRKTMVRMAYTGGWIAGPAFAGLLLSATSGATVLAASGLLQIASVIFVVGLRADRSHSESEASAPAPSALSPKSAEEAAGGGRFLRVRIIVFALLVGEAVRVTLLPALLSDRLGASPVQIGIALSITPAVELLTVPLLAVIASRRGVKAGMLIGALTAIVYYAGIALAFEMTLIYALQAAYAVVVAGVTFCGLLYMESEYDGGPGAAATSYFTTENASTIGGAALATLFAFLTTALWPPFMIAALFCLLSAVLLVTGPKSKLTVEARS